MELGERRVAQRGDLGDERPKPVRVLLGADDMDAEFARRGRELDAAANDGLAVVDCRHQAHLGVDDQERALVGLAENGHRQAPRDRPFSAMRAASAQSAQALPGETSC